MPLRTLVLWLAVVPAHAAEVAAPLGAEHQAVDAMPDLHTQAPVVLTWHGSDWARAQGIVNGQATAGFPSVVALGIETGGGVGTFCSGTLITHTWLLTAGHCVDALHDYQRQGATGVIAYGSDLTRSVDHVAPILAAVSHPEWSGSLDDGADIALVELGQPADVSPMPLVRCDSDLRRPEELDYVGFGITGDGRRDSGVKRVAAIDFDEVQGDFLISVDAEQNLCSGDSGGAALRRTGTGHALVGVNSFVFDTWGDGTSCFTGGSGAIRVAPFLDWIQAESDWTPSPPGNGCLPGQEGTDDPDEGTDDPDPEDGAGGSDPEPEPEPETVDPQDGGSENIPPETIDPTDPLGCACSTAQPVGGLGGLLLVGIVGMVRRRRG